MALFFDGAWFDARLAGLGLSRASIGQVLGLSEDEIAAIWKDQREISAREVALVASLLGVDPALVAEHAGVSTPIPEPDAANALGLAEISDRLARIEMALRELTSLVRKLAAR